MTEAQLELLALASCTEHGLMVLKIPDTRKIRHGKGFPDLLILGSTLLFAELKSSSGTLDADQRRWKWRLLAAGKRWVLWRPADWYSGTIETTLREIA
jgi:hypothetical protein